MNKKWGNKHEAAVILNCAPRTLKNYRDRHDLKENIHWRRRNKTTIDYNLDLLRHYIDNILHPKAHEKFCIKYLKRK